MKIRSSVDAICVYVYVCRQQWDSVPIGKLFDLPQALIDAHDVIGIDEGQFFPDIVEWSDKQANRNGKQVIIAALDGSFQRKPFGRVLELVPCAESVVKLNAVCMNCGADAPFSARISAETELEVVGGADKYIAACRACHDVETELKTIPKINTMMSARKKDTTTTTTATPAKSVDADS